MIRVYTVYILTDDQDVKLGSLDVLPVVKSLLTEQGLYFDNAFVTTPVCCPSRSVVLVAGAAWSLSQSQHKPRHKQPSSLYLSPLWARNHIIGDTSGSDC